MKKFFVVVMGVALCLAFAANASAIDESSLESRTSEGLYDRTDPFDLAMQPGLLYKLDRWRLYTNLSNYSGDDDLDSESYLIGTSGKLGQGSLALFYETNKHEDEWTDSYTGFYRSDTDWGTYPNYDGNYDYLYDWTDSYKGIDDREENNFHAAYSMDFDRFSLGLSLAPEFVTDEETVTVSIPDFDISNCTDARNMFYLNWFGWSPSYGSNYRHSETDRWYADEAHTAYYEETWSESFSGSRDADETVIPIYLQSQIHTADNWHLLAGIFYEDVEEEDDVSGGYIGNYREEDSTSGTGYLYTADLTFNVDGAMDEDYDGNAWGIYLEPVYEVNDMVSLRMDLEYSDEDGDLKGGVLGTVGGTATYAPYASGAYTETWTASEIWNGVSKGDSEGSSWRIEPRVYLTFDKVRFALGMGYEYEDYDADSTSNQHKSVVYTYDDGDGVDTAGAWRSFEGSWTEYMDHDYEAEITTWRFPVATEFDVSEKLTFRAGAVYWRQRVETKSSSVYRDREDENGTCTDETGVRLAVTPDEFFATAPAPGEVGTAYQSWRSGETDTYKTDETDDGVDYHLGLGYQFTENLKFDLMFTDYGGIGGVDLDEAFASVTLAF